jgi:hypothetical protein
MSRPPSSHKLDTIRGSVAVEQLVCYNSCSHLKALYPILIIIAVDTQFVLAHG